MRRAKGWLAVRLPGETLGVQAPGGYAGLLCRGQRGIHPGVWAADEHLAFGDVGHEVPQRGGAISG